MIRVHWQAIAIGLTAIAAVGCAGSADYPATTRPEATTQVSTVQEMCDAISEFFTKDLAVRDVEVRTADNPRSAIYGAGSCSLESAAGPVARASISLLVGADQSWAPSPATTPIDNTSERAWLFDGRPFGLTEVTVRSENRQGVIQVWENHARTANGTLELTDAQVRDIAELCIRLTRYLGG